MHDDNCAYVYSQSLSLRYEDHLRVYNKCCMLKVSKLLNVLVRMSRPMRPKSSISIDTMSTL